MFFCNLCHFPEVKEGRIDLLLFLEASKEIVKFVELLGSVFAPVRLDINGNIEKLHNIHLSNKERFLTLNDIVEYELDQEDKVGTDALLWLKRALEYVFVFLNCLIEDKGTPIHNDNLVPYFNKAYEEKLKPYHGWFVQKIFGLIVLAAPTRKSLMHLLAKGDDAVNEEQILKDAEQFCLNLGKNIDAVNNLYMEHQLDLEVKV